MSVHSVIVEQLLSSFEDFKLSSDEKHRLRTLMGALQSEQELFSFARNKAFDIYRSSQVNESEHEISRINWLERVVKTIDNARNRVSVPTPSVYFSPGEHCLDQILHGLSTAKISIDICVFTISDNRITEAILSAHENGKSIRIISDNDKAKDKGSDVYYLSEQGVPVRLDQSPHHMHHKFALFDQNKLINGSFNWTRSASLKNEENITILYDPDLVKAFSSKFEVLWQQSLGIIE